MEVPKGKKIFVGGRRFIAGDVLPPYLKIEPRESAIDKQRKKNNSLDAKAKADADAKGRNNQ